MIKLQIKPKQRVGLTTHFATHHKNIVDFEEKNSTFCSFNPFVVGSTPAGPTNKTKKGLHICKPFFSFKSLPAPR